MMKEDYSHKSSVEDIRRKFDADVERFSNLDVGQAATVDSPLTLELVMLAAAAICPGAQSVLDIGCGAGNYTLKLLQKLPDLDVTLVDLSANMIERAVKRIRPQTAGQIDTLVGDIRELDLGIERFDVILASQVFHHLRGVEEWQNVFAHCYTALKPGGGLFINDLISHSIEAIDELMRWRWGNYLAGLKDESYRDHVFASVDREDTPRPLYFQLNLLHEVGFQKIDILHKNMCFSAFYAVK